MNLLNDHNGKCMYSLHPLVLYRLITKPSRITSESATLIDNIFTGEFMNKLTTGPATQLYGRKRF